MRTGMRHRDRVGVRNRLKVRDSLFAQNLGVSWEAGLQSSITGEVLGKPGQLVVIPA